MALYSRGKKIEKYYFCNNLKYLRLKMIKNVNFKVLFICAYFSPLIYWRVDVWRFTQGKKSLRMYKKIIIFNYLY